MLGIGRLDAESGRGADLVGQARTVTLVLLGWVLFRAASLPDAIGYYDALFQPGVPLPAELSLALDPLAVLALVVGAVTVVLPASWVTGVRLEYGTSLAIGALRAAEFVVVLPVALVFAAAGGFSPFLYFQFERHVDSRTVAVIAEDRIGRRPRLRDRAVVFAFVLVLAAPGIALIGGVRSPLIENRPATSIPPISIRAMAKSEFFATVDGVVEDAFPLRAAAVQAVGALDYGLFHGSPNRDVIVGRGDWLFLTAEIRPTCLWHSDRILQMWDAFAAAIGRDGIDAGS